MTDRDQLTELTKAIRSYLNEEGYEGAADRKRLEEKVKQAEEHLK